MSEHLNRWGFVRWENDSSPQAGGAKGYGKLVGVEAACFGNLVAGYQWVQPAGVGPICGVYGGTLSLTDRLCG